MPGPVQTRLDLPVRKVRASSSSAKRDETATVMSAPATPGRTRSRMLAPPLDPALESSPRTPRRQTRNRPSKTPSKSEAPADDVGSIKEAQFRTPSKRKGSTAGGAAGDADDGVSPTKLSKSDAKLCAAAGSKENYVIGSPSVHLAKLSLNSPAVKSRRPLAAKSIDNNTLAAESDSGRSGRANLFSPSKLDDKAIEEMLFSPSKAGSKRNINLVVDEDISFKSPVKPRTPRPDPSPRRESLQLCPIKSIVNNTADIKSPAKRSHLESKSPARSSPRKTKSPLKRSPLQSKSPGKSKLSAVSPGHCQPISVDALEDLLCSPVKSKSPLPAKSLSRQSIQALPINNLFSSSSNNSNKSSNSLAVTSVDQLEDLMCSPVKARSPRKTVNPTKSPGRNLAPAKSPARNLATSKSPARSLIPVRSPRKPVTPVKSPRKGAANLFSSPVKPSSLLAPTKPSTPVELHKADLSQFQAARQALHTGTPEELLCRSEQVDVMAAWLDKHLLTRSPGSLYVSGAPGTGKTASLNHLLTSRLTNQKTVFINCMILKSAVSIYKEVAKQLNKKSVAKTEKEALKEIEKVVTSKGEMILLVLDEVDQLESKNQDVLYTVFEWPALAGSRLSLVGIANTLDLTDRVLPRLQIKECYRPTLLHYPPYNKQQIITIINKRLETMGVTGDVITARAIAFLAGKISTLSGDIRKALDVCRRALEQAESAARKQSLLKPLTPRGLNSPSKSPHKGYKVPKALPKVGQVDLPQIMRVFTQVYGSKLNTGMSSGSGGIPSQQKILLSSLLLMVLKGTNKEVTLGKLVQTYTKVCKHRGLTASEEAECVGMVQSLESRGILKYVTKGAPRYAKISLRLDEKEVEMALEDKALLASILQDTALIC